MLMAASARVNRQRNTAGTPDMYGSLPTVHDVNPSLDGIFPDQNRFMGLLTGKLCSVPRKIRRKLMD